AKDRVVGLSNIPVPSKMPPINSTAEWKRPVYHVANRMSQFRIAMAPPSTMQTAARKLSGDIMWPSVLIKQPPRLHRHLILLHSAVRQRFEGIDAGIAGFDAPGKLGVVAGLNDDLLFVLV